MVNETSNREAEAQTRLHRACSKNGGDTFEPPEFLHDVREAASTAANAVHLGRTASRCTLSAATARTGLSAYGVHECPSCGARPLFPILAEDDGVLAPAGWHLQIDPEGKDWELWSVGLRNALTRLQPPRRLFTYDSDMDGT